MSIGPVPQSQLDSLPLITAAQAATAGTLQLIGGTMYRRFTAAQLGINGSVASLANGSYSITGNYLDLRGTSKYMFALRCVNANISIARPGCVLQWQMRMGSTDTPAPAKLVGGSYNSEMNSILYIGTTFIFPATTAPGEVLTKLIAWESGSPSNFNNNATVFGTDVRPIISFLGSTGPTVNDLFTAYLVASS